LRPFLFKLSILFGFIFAFPQCTHFKIPTSPSIICSPQQILMRLKEESISVGLKGIAKVRVESPDEKFSVKEVIIAKRPKCLRLETLNPLGHPLFLIVTDGEELVIFSPPENKFYHGIASSKNVASILHVNLGLEETISIMLGKIPLIDYDAEKIKCYVKGNLCVLRLFTRDGRLMQVLKVSLHNQMVVESKTYDKGEDLILSLKYGNYEQFGEVLLPREISVTMPHDETKVKISYKEIKLLSEIDPAEFRLTPPQGAEIIPLE